MQTTADTNSVNSRGIAVFLAILLGLCGILMIFSLLSALFGIGFFPGYVGGFFARSFGILSLLIPAYLAYAAFILADRHWRPERVFVLNACVFPFLTLGVGFAFIRDFEVRSEQLLFLELAGKTGFSLFIIFLTVMEVLLLQVLKNAVFKKSVSPKKRRCFRLRLKQSRRLRRQLFRQPQLPNL
uniref:Cell division protein FtsK n=1 Tax=uncultured bacterium contig00059 TaxID=1181542 RepID=A0A0A6ZH59_9BACT|nr:cell division protein FtsK [uncultured bacterium contig00059]